jgi:hypothetical protein
VVWIFAAARLLTGARAGSDFLFSTLWTCWIFVRATDPFASRPFQMLLGNTIRIATTPAHETLPGLMGNRISAPRRLFVKEGSRVQHAAGDGWAAKSGDKYSILRPFLD